VRRQVLLILAAAVLAGCAARLDAPIETGLSYPETRRVDQVDDYFGTLVADPYRWLEDMESPEVDAWVEAQNALAIGFLTALPDYERIHARLDVLWRTERMSVPRVHSGRYFFEYNDGEATLGQLMTTDALDGEWRMLLDPVTLSPDGTVLLARWNVSPDGKLIAWAATDGGSDWTWWQVRDVASGEDLPIRIDGTKSTDAVWRRDGAGFYYSRYPRNGAGDWDDQAQASIYLHMLGTVQADDVHVFSITDHPTRTPFPMMSSDGRHLVIMVWQDSRNNGIYLLPLDAPGAEPIRLVDSWDGRSSYLGSVGDTVYVRTNIGAPRGRVVAIDLARPAQAHWRDVVAESAWPIEDASLIGDEFIVHYLDDAKSRVERFALDGQPRGPLTLPGIGRVFGFTGSPESSETFFLFQGFENPGTVFSYRPADGEPRRFYQKSTALDTAALETHQVFYTSKDGTRVPMFIVHRKGIQLDGANPTMLYGYGGFNVSMLPGWDLRLLGWLDLGGVLAIANLRGGGEYGADWHAAGTREQKQNTFDDFIAAAEWLIAERWTSPQKLAIYGRSNGGLLVGAVQLQRPELFAAAGPAVGVLDMLRYHLPSANARNWRGDYGLSEIESEFRAQLAYSPVHNVRPGVCHPATIIHSARRDDRVVPWHSYKFAAELQRHQACDRPILLRIESRAGHGSGGAKPRHMLIDEFAELYAFFAWALGVSGYVSD
jgi:prolyl oligopeptidase